MVATGSKTAISVGILKLTAKKKISSAAKTNPAAWDQKKVLKCPIFLEKRPAKKSDVPHPNIPPSPASMLKKIGLITVIYIFLEILYSGYGFSVSP